MKLIRKLMKLLEEEQKRDNKDIIKKRHALHVFFLIISVNTI